MSVGSTIRAKLVTALPLLGAVLGASALFGACADAIHLNPVGGTTTSSTGTGGAVTHKDGGTDAPATGACRSNPECAYPTPVCDTAAQTCVECLVISDCAGKPGTVCSLGACGCPSLDAAETFTYCTGETPACVDTSSSPTNCGGCGHTCYGACAAGKCGNAWSPLTASNPPEARSHHVAVWTGSKMVVWGGRDGGNYLASGGVYDPVAQTWTPTSAVNAPSARADATAIWDDVDHLMLVWGGQTTGGYLSDGATYDPAKDAWTTMNPAGAPTARAGHSAIWAKATTGAPTMIIWGGMGAGTPGYVADGGLYDPVADAWTGIPASAAGSGPTARAYHAGVWDSGSRMIVFGGLGSAGAPMMPVVDGDVWSFDPTQIDAGSGWNQLTQGTPPARYNHTGIWDPVSMTTLIWGGFDNTTYLTDGAALSATTWSTLGNGGTLPEGRVGHSSVILTVSGKSKLAIFGGDEGAGNILDAGAILDIAGNMWGTIPTPGPTPRTHHTAVANGSTMIVWGGDTAAGPTNSGGAFDASQP